MDNVQVVADFLTLETLEVNCCRRHGGYRTAALAEHAKVNRDKPQTKETMYVPPKTTTVQTYLACNNDVVMTLTSEAIAFVTSHPHGIE